MQVTAGEKLLMIPGAGFGIQAPKAHGPRVYLLQREVSVSSPKGRTSSIHDLGSRNASRYQIEVSGFRIQAVNAMPPKGPARPVKLCRPLKFGVRASGEGIP